MKKKKILTAILIAFATANLYSQDVPIDQQDDIPAPASIDGFTSYLLILGIILLVYVTYNTIIKSKLAE